MLVNIAEYENLLDISGQIFIITDIEGRIAYSNRRDFLPEGAFFLLSEHRQKLPDGKTYQSQIGYKAPYYYISLKDITDNLKLSDMLQRVSARLEFAEKTAKLGYWEIDINQRIIYWSAEMYRILKVEESDSSSKRKLLERRIFKEDIPVYRSKISELLKHRRQVEGNLRLKYDKGEISYCQFRAEYHKDSRKISGTLQDITSMIEIHIALNKAKINAEQAVKAKSYFLAQASHDLRQPMQALTLFVDALQEDEGLSRRQQQLVSKIEASAHNLKYLLDSLLDLSKLESGGIECQQQEFNIGTLLYRLSMEYADLAKMHHIMFKIQPCSCKVSADPLLTERILRNFLGNALKFTKNKILLGCKKKGKYLEICVIDNGKGIPENEQKNIFQEFYQIKEAQGEEIGAGLGLTISAKLARLMGTSISLKSVPGKGSCFSFALPYAE